MTTDLDDIQTRIPAALVSGRMDASVGAMAANVMTAAAAAADLTTELQTGLATAASITTLNAFVDTEVAAILAAVDTEIAALVTATSAASIRTALGLASANIDTQFATSATAVDALPTNAELTTALATADDATLAAVAAGFAAAPALLLDLANGVETGITLRQAQRVQLDVASAKINGAGTTSVNIRNQADTLNRVAATVDVDGNRSAVTLNLG